MSEVFSPPPTSRDVPLSVSPLVTDSSGGGGVLGVRRSEEHTVLAYLDICRSAGRGGRGGHSSQGSTPFPVTTDEVRGTSFGGRLPKGFGGTSGAGVRGGKVGVA